MKHKYTREILPCPFCNNALPTLVITDYNKKEKFYHIQCKCGAMMMQDGMLFTNRNKCIRAWNKRKGVDND